MPEKKYKIIANEKPYKRYTGTPKDPKKCEYSGATVGPALFLGEMTQCNLCGADFVVDLDIEHQGKKIKGGFFVHP